MPTKNLKARPVVVTTEHRGVFFGYATDTEGATIKLGGMRNCRYWSKDMQGFVGLAKLGPSSECLIGPAADAELRNITCVLEVTPEAEKKWNSHAPN